MMLMETRFTSQFLTLKIIRFPLAIFFITPRGLSQRQHLHHHRTKAS